MQGNRNFVGGEWLADGVGEVFRSGEVNAGRYFAGDAI
jgi:hypothetical protein